MSVTRPVHMICRGCGFEHSPDDPRPFRCARSDELPRVDHMLVRQLDPSTTDLALGFESDEPNPFLRYRAGLYPYANAVAHGLSDGEYVAMVHLLDRAIESVDGQGFRITPLDRQPGLARAVGLGEGIELWVKNETGNVSGSHKARHLMGVQLWLEMAQRVGLVPDTDAPHPDLAIASCGNAALAAGVVAMSARQHLRVFVPTDAEASVLARLQELGAEIQECPRDPLVVGDPCMHAFHAALEEGLIPFGCQGNENGMTLEGGRTLGYEWAEQLRRAKAALDELVVQVGGGALGSSTFLALREAQQLGVLERLPRFHTVQTEGAHPLHRAWSKVVDRILRTQSSAEPDLAADLERATAAAAAPAAKRKEALDFAVKHRGDFMWPWESVPHSVAHGILDDETYDWHVLVEGMVETGGVPVIAPEPVLEKAHAMAHEAGGIAVCSTGSAGLAGIMELDRAGAFAEKASVGTVFSGHQR